MVEEGVERGGDADAAFGASGAEEWFKEVRVSGVNLQTHHAEVAVAPAARRVDPAKVIDAHALNAVTADAVLVASAFSPEVLIGGGVVEDAGRRSEVFKLAGFPGGCGRSSYKVNSAGLGDPKEHHGLDRFAAIGQKNVLRLRNRDARGGEVFREKTAVEVLFVLRELEPGFDFSGEAWNKERAIDQIRSAHGQEQKAGSEYGIQRHYAGFMST